jgi:hypothetical protein
LSLVADLLLAMQVARAVPSARWVTRAANPRNPVSHARARSGSGLKRLARKSQRRRATFVPRPMLDALRAAGCSTRIATASA